MANFSSPQGFWAPHCSLQSPTQPAGAITLPHGIQHSTDMLRWVPRLLGTPHVSIPQMCLSIGLCFFLCFTLFQFPQPASQSCLAATAVHVLPCHSSKDSGSKPAIYSVQECETHDTLPNHSQAQQGAQIVKRQDLSRQE